MTILDIIIALLLLAGAWGGFRKGLIIELASLAALVLGIYGAVHFSGFAAGWLEHRTSLHGQGLQITSFVITFFILIAMVMIGGKLLEKLVNLAMLGIPYKLAGALFGLLRSAVMISILLYMLNLLHGRVNIISGSSKEKSALYGPVAAIAPAIFGIFNLDERLPGWSVLDGGYAGQHLALDVFEHGASSG
jgi:membrane protein required for colicin V production